jgi:glycosyltransferase involved in cell wall biosynthesis
VNLHVSSGSSEKPSSGRRFKAWWSDARECVPNSITPTRSRSETGLPPGLSPSSRVGELAPPARIWPNRFVLTVGTIEERKDHLTVLKAWRELLQNYPAKDLPDLLCAGRLGWGSTSFIRELLEDTELAKKIHIPEGPVSDTDLYRLYRDCEFTIFASRAEGWGLPITESLAFGKPVVAAAGSSLPEAGGNTAVYFEPGDYLQLSTIVERLNRDGDYFASVVSQIALRDLPTWAGVTEHLRREIGVAHRTTAPGRNSGPRDSRSASNTPSSSRGLFTVQTRVTASSGSRMSTGACR